LNLPQAPHTTHKHHELTTPYLQNMTLLFSAAQKIITEQVNKGVTIDDVGTLVVPIDGNEALALTSSLNQR
jgi:hypothetical protein